ncbi:hypothetical protein BSKO_06301 [Bryopsis sp. KO-2023]|nr:hypothetical protein BSKO_06301 [Bryopsis sp. KO-2023]
MESSRVYTPRAFSAFSVFRDARVLPVRKSSRRMHVCSVVSRGKLFLSSWSQCKFRCVEMMSTSSYAMHPAADSTPPKLLFTLPCQVPFGVVLRLVGSAPELGNWLIDNGIDFEWNEGHVWRLTVHNPPTLTCSYKVVAINTFDGSVEWETCNNRILEPSESDMDIELAWNEWTPTKQGPPQTADEQEEQGKSTLPETEEEEEEVVVEVEVAPTEAVVDEAVGREGDSESKDEDVSQEVGDASWNLESAVDEEAGVGIESEFAQAVADSHPVDASASLDECSSVVEAVELKAETAETDDDVSESPQDCAENEGPEDDDPVGKRNGASQDEDVKDVETTTAMDVAKDLDEVSSPERVSETAVPRKDETAGIPMDSPPQGAPAASSDRNAVAKELDEKEAAFVLGKDPTLQVPDQSEEESENKEASATSDVKQPPAVAGKTTPSDPALEKEQAAGANGKGAAPSASDQNGAQSDDNVVSEESKGKQASVVAEKSTLPKPGQDVSKAVEQEQAAVVSGKESTPGEPQQTSKGSVDDVSKDSDQKQPGVVAKEEPAPSKPELSVDEPKPSKISKESDQKQEAAAVAEGGSTLSKPEQIAEESGAEAAHDELMQCLESDAEVVVDAGEEFWLQQAAVAAKEGSTIPQQDPPTECVEAARAELYQFLRGGVEAEAEFWLEQAVVAAKEELTRSKPDQVVSKPDVTGEEVDQKRPGAVAKEEPTRSKPEQAPVVAKKEPTPSKPEPIAKEAGVKSAPKESDQKQPGVVAKVAKSEQAPVVAKEKSTLSKPEQAPVVAKTEPTPSKPEKTPVVTKEEPTRSKPEQAAKKSDVKVASKKLDQKQPSVVAKKEPTVPKPEPIAKRSGVKVSSEKLDQKQPGVAVKKEPTVPKPEPIAKKSGVKIARKKSDKKQRGVVAKKEPTLSKPSSKPTQSVDQPNVAREELVQKRPGVAAKKEPTLSKPEQAPVVAKKKPTLSKPPQKPARSVGQTGANGDRPSSAAEMAPTTMPAGTPPKAKQTTTKRDAAAVGVESTTSGRGAKKTPSVPKMEKSPAHAGTKQAKAAGDRSSTGAGVKLNGAGKKDESSVPDMVVDEEDGSVLFTSDSLSKEVPAELAAAFDSLLPEAYRQVKNEKEQQGVDGKAGAAAGVKGNNPLSPGLTAAALGVGTVVLGSIGLELTDAIVGGALLFVGSAAVFSKAEDSRRKERGVLAEKYKAKLGVGGNTAAKADTVKGGDELRASSAPGVALAALFMLPLMAGSKVLDSVEKVQTKSKEADTEEET